MKKIILGTVQFGLNYGINNVHGKPTLKEVYSILDRAHLRGIRLLDSAEAYGDSQEIIGTYHKKSENKFEIITKYCPKRTDLPTNITERVHKNLEILNVNSLYCYMFHSYSDFKQYFDLYKSELLKLREEGILGKIGVSLHENQEILDVLSNPEIGLIQLPYNLFDNKLKREEVFSLAKRKGIEIHTRSTFLQGLFFKDLEAIESKIVPLKKHLTRLNEIINNSDIHSIALNYVLHNPKIDGVLLGVDNKNQLEKNLKSIKDKIDINVFRCVDSINIEEEYLLNPVNW